MPTPRVFLLSPARTSGRRADALLAPSAQFELARALRARTGAPLGEVMTFLSGLYFRGKLAYARAFAQPPDALDATIAGGVLVITADAGLRPPDARVTATVVRASSRVDIDVDNVRYRRPLVASARRLRRRLGADCDVVLLGSIATGKYVDVLGDVFGDRLRFPVEFVGRGDMSRGGLLLRCVRESRELTYVAVTGSVRHGARPPRLEPPWRAARAAGLLPSPVAVP